MAERKVGCVSIASPTGVADPYSSPMREAGTTMAEHLNDWN